MPAAKKTDDDNSCQQTSNHLKSKDKRKPKTASKHGGKDTPSLSGDDSSTTADGPRNDKLDDKLLTQDPTLLAVIEAWPELPEEIKAGILAMVEAFTRKEDQ